MAWIFGGFLGPCLSGLDFWWFFSAQNVKNEKIDENSRKTGACLRLLDFWWFGRTLLEAAGFFVVF